MKYFDIKYFICKKYKSLNICESDISKKKGEIKVKLTRQKLGKGREGKIISYVVAPFFIIYNNIYNKKGGVSIGGLRIAKSN